MSVSYSECFDLLQSSQSCVADKGTSDDEETMEDGMCQPTKVAASYISILDQAWVRNPKHACRNALKMVIVQYSWNN